MDGGLNFFNQLMPFQNAPYPRDQHMNTAPTPFELFLASIGTCAGIYVKGFCDQRSIQSDNIKIILNIEYEKQTGLPKNININILLPKDFPPKYKAAVMNAADLCKVKKTIASQPKFEVSATIQE